MKLCPICKGKLEDTDNKCHVCGYFFSYEDKYNNDVMLEKYECF